MNTNGLKLTAAAAAIATALTGAYSLGHANSPTTPPPSAISQPPAAAASLPDMSSIVAVNSPSVVNISVSGARKGSSHPQLDEDESARSFSAASAPRKTAATHPCAARDRALSSAPTEPF